MGTSLKIKTVIKLGVPLAAAALAMTACASSSGNSSASSAPAGGGGGATTSAPAPAPAPAAGTSAGGGATSPAKASAAGAVVKTASGAAGTFLVDGSGKTLYLWVADSKDKSTCEGSCANAWPPLTTKGMPTASGSAKAADLGTIKRADGTTQVTYNGHPLYYFAGDGSAGQTTGQGSDSFGAKWWLVTPAGASITGGAPAAASSSASSGGGGGGGWA